MHEPFFSLSTLAQSAAGGVGGAVVGCTLGGERHVAIINNPSYKPVTRRSIFEIASVTKALTGILLAIMADRGEVILSETVDSVFGIKNLPDLWSSITLLDLATHHSGLPTLPPNLDGPPWNPYRGWGSNKLYDAMRQVSTAGSRDRWSYSNFGIAVLAEALSRRAELPYVDLVENNICQPLGLHNTLPTSVCREREQISGYTFWGGDAEFWDFEGMIGAGGISSTIDDLLSIAEELLDPGPSALKKALQISVGRDVCPGQSRVALCWFVRMVDGRQIIWTSGGVAGFSSFMAVHFESKVAVVALLNSGRPIELVRAASIALSRLCSM